MLPRQVSDNPESQGSTSRTSSVQHERTSAPDLLSSTQVRAQLLTTHYAYLTFGHMRYLLRAMRSHRKNLGFNSGGVMCGAKDTEKYRTAPKIHYNMTENSLRQQRFIIRYTAAPLLADVYSGVYPKGGWKSNLPHF